VPKSAESDFRGFPNLVHGGELNGIGHPGFEVCKSTQLDKNTIKVHSFEGGYAWRWVAYEDHLAIRLDEVNPGRNYWFLYEGIPGGTYEPDNIIWGTQQGIRSDKPDFLKGETLEENWHWVFFTANNANNTLCLVQTEIDVNADVMGLMGNTDKGMQSPDGMVVFGFGRSKNTEPLLHRPYTFLVSMYPKAIKNENDHNDLKNHVEKLLAQHR
jgi:hypothetical protein